MPERNDNVGKYRFGFQNQELDNDIKGLGNSINFKYRMHDPRLGRFFAIDPLYKTYPYQSPYVFGENRIMDGIELEGKEWSPVTIMFGRAEINTSTARSIEEKVDKGIQAAGKIAGKALTYGGIGASIAFGGAPGIILGIPALGMNLGKDISNATNPNSKANAAPSGLGEAIGMIPDRLYEGSTGTKTNLGQSLGGFGDALLTSPLNRIGTSTKMSLIPSESGQFIDGVISTTKFTLDIMTTKIQLPQVKEQKNVSIPDANSVKVPSIEKHSTTESDNE